jgi:hypothetical protein
MSQIEVSKMRSAKADKHLSVSRGTPRVLKTYSAPKVTILKPKQAEAKLRTQPLLDGSGKQLLQLAAKLAQKNWKDLRRANAPEVSS